MHLPALPHRFRPRRRRRSARLRLTALYGVLSVLSGAVLVAGVYTWQLSIASVQPAVPAPPAASPQQPPLAQAQARIQQLQYQVNALSDRMNAITPHSLLVGLVIGLGIMAVVSAVLGWLVAGRTLRPLRVMTADHPADLRGRPAPAAGHARPTGRA